MTENPYASPRSAELASGSASNSDLAQRLKRIGVLGIVGFSTSSLIDGSLNPDAGWRGVIVVGTFFAVMAMSSEVLESSTGYKLSVILRVGLTIALWIASIFTILAISELLELNPRTRFSDPWANVRAAMILLQFGGSMFLARQFLKLCVPQPTMPTPPPAVDRE